MPRFTLSTLPIALAFMAGGCADAKATPADCEAMAQAMKELAFTERAKTPEARKAVEATEVPRWVEICKADPPNKKTVECVKASTSSNQARLCDGSSATPPPAPPAPPKMMMGGPPPPRMGMPPGAKPGPGGPAPKAAGETGGETGGGETGSGETGGGETGGGETGGGETGAEPTAKAGDEPKPGAAEVKAEPNKD